MSDGADARAMRRATYAALGAAGALAVIKLVAWLVSGSIAVLSLLFDSLLDAAASFVNLLAVRHALDPADREHRFGHGKAEALAGLGQAAFVAGSALFVWVEAGRRLLDPKPPAATGVAIGVIAASLAATLALVAFQRRVVRRTGSLAIAADSLHYQGDLLAGAGVIGALVVSERSGWSWVDPACGAAIAAYILGSAWRILRSSLDQLMDRELCDADRERIRAIARAHPEVIDVHDLRTRAAGRSTFIQLHLELDPSLSLLRAHQIADEVERQLDAAFPGAEVIIHEDPSGVAERRDSFAR